MDTMTPPIPYARLQEIATEACTQALSGASSYEHTRTESWNTSIINSILQSLISEASTPPSNSPAYKFAVNSTIIQHQVPTAPSTVTLSTGAAETASESHPVAGTSGDERSSAGHGAGGRRGMHSATGAYWNNERDGLWNYKFEGGEGRGLDVVVSVIWIGI